MSSTDEFARAARAILRAGIPAALEVVITHASDRKVSRRSRLKAMEIVLCGVERGAWTIPQHLAAAFFAQVRKELR